MLSGVNDYGGKCTTFELASSVHKRPPMLFYLNFVSVRHQQCTSNNHSFNKLLFLNKAMLKGKREKERGKAEMFADEGTY